MEFPSRGAEEGHQHRPHYLSGQDGAMEFSNRGYEEGHHHPHSEFPNRGAEEGHHHHPHYFSGQDGAMEFPNRGYEEGHHHPPHTVHSGHTEKAHAMEFPNRGAEEGHHPHYFSGQHEQLGHAYEEEVLYPPIASVYEPTPHASAAASPYTHTSHAPSPFAHTPPGPYGTHGSSGPYYPRPHQAFVSELPSSEYQPQLPQGQLVRVFCKKNQAFNLAAELNGVIMKPANTQDEAQQWIKDDSYGMRIRDNYGHSAFSLVNKKTGKILKHAKQKGHQVLLMEYRPDIRDDDILWSESQDFGEGFKTVRCASDTLLNLTVFEGVKTVRNGSPLVLDTWHKGDHQLWKLFPL